MTDREKKPHPDIKINTKWCKKCGICIAVCPLKVYTTAEDGSPSISSPEKCTRCGICVIMCPDFAISGIKKKG